MMQPFNKPGGTFIKKPKLAKPMEKMNLSKSPTKTDPKMKRKKSDGLRLGGRNKDAEEKKQ